MPGPKAGAPASLSVSRKCLYHELLLRGIPGSRGSRSPDLSGFQGLFYPTPLSQGSGPRVSGEHGSAARTGDRRSEAMPLSRPRGPAAVGSGGRGLLSASVPRPIRKRLIFCENPRPSLITPSFITGIKAETTFCCIVKFGPFGWKNLNDQASMCFYSDMFYDMAVKSCLRQTYRSSHCFADSNRTHS